MENVNLEQLKGMSNFEVAALFLENAKENEIHHKAVNVGRGNPNWINTLARFAFNKIIEFGMSESLKTINEDNGNMAGYIEKEKIAERFQQFLDEKQQTDQFILKFLEYTTNTMHLDADELVFEFVNGAIGNEYPVPSRALVNVEKILNRYLESTLYNGEKLADQTDVFPTEGGTAAMVYLFNELKISHLLNPGDKIAINTPIFTPYLQIPGLNEYQLLEFDLASDESDDWQMIDDKFEQLKDPSVKAFFVVNPTNPTSRAFSQRALNKIKEVVAANPELIIITDDVYGTFVNNFQTIYSVVPHNTLLVYSYSKLYGATGSRLGLIAMHQNNIFDQLIQKKTLTDASIKAEFEKRYSLVVPDPLAMKFIDRTVADSRAIGLYHTAGLSTPQQVQMALFSLTNLIYEGQKDPYIEASKQLVIKRYKKFYDAIGIENALTEDNAFYYSVFSLYDLAQAKYGSAFRTHFEKGLDYLQFEEDLAKKYGVVVMDGSGMGTKPGYIRISLANQSTEAYEFAGECIAKLLQEYYEQFKQA